MDKYEQALQDKRERMTSLISSMKTQTNVRGRGIEMAELRADIEWLETAIARRNAKAERTRQTSAVGDRFKTRTFANFDEERQVKAYGICKRFADNFDNIQGKEKNSIVLMGNCGTGKTHLVASIANQLIDRGIRVVYGTYGDHLNKIKSEFGQSGKHLEAMQTAPLLIVDDYGKEKESAWVDEIWFEVINARYERMLPTVITTNLSAEEFNVANGNAIQSRLSEMAVIVKVDGKDYRRK